MSIVRDDRWVTDALGNALAGAEVYWCTQPAATASNPPSPLATAYADLNGDPLTQPALTDGFGHAYAYLDNSVLYTVVVWHPLFGPNPVVLPDQSLAGAGSAGTQFAGPLLGTINGSNTIFTLTNGGTALTVTPTTLILWDNFPLVVGVGYTLGPNPGQVTFTAAPQVDDTLYGQGTHN
jgi:hypothetical protein